MLKNALGIVGMVALGASLSSPVMAAGNDAGFFGSNTLRLGAGIGMNYVSIDGTVTNFDEHATALEAFVGYEFNRWLAVEGGYLNGGNAAMDFFDGAIRVESKGVYATVLGSLPITDAFSIYGRAGMVRWDAESRETVDRQVVAQGKDDGTDPIFGVGLAGEVDGAFMRLEYRYVDMDGAKSKIVGVSVVWRIPLGR